MNKDTYINEFKNDIRLFVEEHASNNLLLVGVYEEIYDELEKHVKPECKVFPGTTEVLVLFKPHTEYGHMLYRLMGEAIEKDVPYE